MAEAKACALIRDRFPDAIVKSEEFRGETRVTVTLTAVRPVLAFLMECDETLCDLLLDIVAVDLGKESPRFRIIYLLHSMKYNRRLAIDVAVPEGASVDTVSGLWKAADWMEREVYDMFGIVFADHPDLRRILLPEEFDGHPLRKDFPLQGVDFDKPFPVCLEETKGNQTDG
jgi:NADH-quinone oxidoreductase subunit C